MAAYEYPYSPVFIMNTSSNASTITGTVTVSDIIIQDVTINNTAGNAGTMSVANTVTVTGTVTVSDIIIETVEISNTSANAGTMAISSLPTVSGTVTITGTPNVTITNTSANAGTVSISALSGSVDVSSLPSATSVTYGGTILTSTLGQIIATATNRKAYLIINNSSGTTVFIGFGTDLTTSNGIPIGYQQSISDSSPGVYSGSVYGMVTAASGSADIRYMTTS